jgi:class 3 adenylate cyclase/ABC-type branched-subunit amino acid transport system substrate-binding protein/sugar lactone lactonase YvrE
MTELPIGTITLLFTDIEGSTRLLKQLGPVYDTVLADHQRILRECFEAHGGREVDTQGDSFFVAFGRAGDAVASAAEAQRALARHPWPDDSQVRVRMGLHTGEPRPTGERYVGFGVHRAARIGAVGHGGQVLLSNATRELVEDELPPSTRVRDLGAFELKDLDRPERLYQLDIEGLPSEFPPLKAQKVAEPRHVRRRTVLLALAAALLLAAAVVAFASWSGRSKGGAVVAAGGRVVAVDASTGAVDRQISAGRTPTAIAAGDGGVWVVDADARTVVRIDEASEDVETFSTGATPTDVAVGPGAVWVANGERLQSTQFVGPVATSVARIDPVTRAERANVALPYDEGDVSNLVDNHLAATDEALWAVTPDFAVVRIEAATGAITAKSTAVPAVAVAAGPAGVWALGSDGGVARLDERTARPLSRAKIPVPVTSIAVGENAAWVTSSPDGTLWRVAGGANPQLGTITLAPGIGDVAVGANAVWVTNPLAGTLSQVDPETATVTHTTEVDGIPLSVAVDGGTVWVAAVEGPEEAVTKEVAGIEPLSSRVCESVLAGSDEADLLVVSDLPLQGGVQITTAQMAQAIAFVLRERGFRAGRFSIAYQSCDDSIASTGLFDEAKCESNARAYAANPHVIGVIGTLNSPCALAALPALNRAQNGPLAMVSPSNSFVGLTRQGPGIHPSLPASLYPTGRRNYIRVYPTDDLQGAALALFAKDRGRKRVFVLDDGDPGYGALMGTGFETASRRLGLSVAGRASWDPRANDYSSLADRVARSGATAVFIGGLIDTNAAQVVRDLRSRLGRSVDLLGPDGLTPLPLLVDQAGDAAVGVYATVPGVLDRLPPGGMRFVERFGRTQAGADIEPTSVYAAQATEVLLDAIGRSDGTRASVVEELFRTRVENGLLGRFGFDRNGDITESPVTIVRVLRKGSSTNIQSIDGAVIERVVRPQASLVR